VHLPLASESETNCVVSEDRVLEPNVTTTDPSTAVLILVSFVACDDGRGTCLMVTFTRYFRLVEMCGTYAISVSEVNTRIESSTNHAQVLFNGRLSLIASLDAVIDEHAVVSVRVRCVVGIQAHSGPCWSDAQLQTYVMKGKLMKLPYLANIPRASESPVGRSGKMYQIPTKSEPPATLFVSTLSGLVSQ
jgi:hypothetical protein